MRLALGCGLSNLCFPYCNTSFRILKTVKTQTSARPEKTFLHRQLEHSAQSCVTLTLKSYSSCVQLGERHSKCSQGLKKNESKLFFNYGNRTKILKYDHSRQIQVTLKYVSLAEGLF